MQLETLSNNGVSMRFSAIPAQCSCNAVSYTHLDVYKRQVFYCEIKDKAYIKI